MIQARLNFGQKSQGLIVCKICSFAYSNTFDQDLKLHSKFHKQYLHKFGITQSSDEVSKRKESRDTKNMITRQDAEDLDWTRLQKLSKLDFNIDKPGNTNNKAKDSYIYRCDASKFLENYCIHPKIEKESLDENAQV